MKKYSFISADGKDVEVAIEASYRGECLKDFSVIIDGDVWETEEDDGSDVFDIIEQNTELMPNQAHFVETVLTSVMAYGEMTLDEALSYQARWEAENSEN